ncbi:hypothetical protein GKC49_31580, partial [Pantoea agglomerans]|nr:hypothetical protein [Pantoea agglomerans]
MKKALAKYANRESANVQLDIPVGGGGVVAPPYEDVKKDLKQVVDQIANYTDNFTRTPDDDNRVEEMYSSLRKYNHLMSMAKQDDK